ncbi:hypothetical protein MLD38_014471 [Melastoma candidum]|uniref:Uncharacterized protein n=1 Tax=Melastoma candidum TaxID=119954 RepID=A0ACB9RDF9_9MYRT|nr:hypothetical protein MLD38_014471 [Melastoma candidum]
MILLISFPIGILEIAVDNGPALRQTTLPDLEEYSSVSGLRRTILNEGPRKLVRTLSEANSREQQWSSGSEASTYGLIPRRFPPIWSGSDSRSTGLGYLAFVQIQQNSV